MSVLGTDPEHVNWLTALIGFLAGMLSLAVAKLFRRTEFDTRENSKETKDHIKESDTRYAKIETRLAILENQKLVTLPELRLAIKEAIDQAKELFTPQHEAVERSLMQAITDSEKRNADLVQQCNTALRQDLNETVKAVDKIFRTVLELKKPASQRKRRTND